jgi:SAM-dependent methyltransferase
MSSSREDAARNRELWTRSNAEYTDANAREAWAAEEITWGVWGIPEAELDVLPDLAGKDVVELGCGTAYVSAWLMRLGARVVGLDNSSNQLATARRFQTEFDLRFALVHADAEHAPFADESFDFAISQYGAAIWCDPYKWVPEASRILRPGGRLVFETGSPLVMLCFPTDDDDAPADTRLHRDFFGMNRFEWRAPDGTVEDIEFRLGHGDMIRLLTSCGFEIEDLMEIQAPIDGIYHAYIPLDWARRWPSAEAWKVRKRR